MERYTTKEAASLPKELLVALPLSVRNELCAFNAEVLNEIRLRAGGQCSVILNGKARALESRISKIEMDETVNRLCDGSLYAYRDTISKGYISLSGGIRVGVCGRAVYEGGKLLGVYDISSLCIRIPRCISGLGEKICRLIVDKKLTDGILIYSTPGVGKTTLLRSITHSLAASPVNMRVALIDTRGELAFGLPEGLCCDVLSGYEKGYGIELAVRCLNPQLIVCDEIGSDISEANAIKSAHNSGVPLLASAHAVSFASLMRRPAFAELHRASCFGYYAGIVRKGNDYTYTVNYRDSV